MKTLKKADHAPHGLLLGFRDPAALVGVVGGLAVFDRIAGFPIRGVVAALASLDANELTRAGARRPAEVGKSLGLLRGKAFLLRLDRPVVEAPQMDIHLTVVCPDLPLLEALAPAVRCLPTHIVFKRVQFLRRQFPNDAAHGDAPQLTVPFFCGKDNGAHLGVDAVIRVVPVHDPALGFFCHTILFQCREDLIGIVGERVTIQRGVKIVIQIAPIVVFGQVGGQRHIQLHGVRFRRQDGKSVLTDDHAQMPSVIPLDVEGADIVDMLQCPHAAGGDGVWFVRAHLPKTDSGALGILFPQELQPFRRQFHLTFLPSPCPYPASAGLH